MEPCYPLHLFKNKGNARLHILINHYIRVLGQVAQKAITDYYTAEIQVIESNDRLGKLISENKKAKSQCALSRARKLRRYRPIIR